MTDKKPSLITAEMIAKAFDVPLEMLGLLPPDAGETIAQAAFDGTLTGEAFIYADGGVLKNWSPPIADCLANNSPYVPGHLGANCWLAYKTEQNMPHKKFPAKEPDPNSPVAGIPAHTLFTSGLMATPEEAAKVAKETLAKQLLKTTGDVKVQKLDEQGNPTGDWITLGHASAFNLDYMDLGHEEAFAEAVEQHEKVTKLQTKLSNHASGLAVDVPLPQFTTVKGGVKYPVPDHMHFEVDGQPLPDDYSDVPEGFYVKEDPDWGEQLVPIPGYVSTAAEPLFDPVPTPLIHPLAHLWCTACDVHWMGHTGDPVACDSGGYLRPSTPLEDKQYVDRLRMLKESGLT